MGCEGLLLPLAQQHLKPNTSHPAHAHARLPKQDVDSGHHGSGFPLPLWRRRLLEQHLARAAAAGGGGGGAPVELPNYANGAWVGGWVGWTVQAGWLCCFCRGRRAVEGGLEEGQRAEEPGDTPDH